MKSILLTLVLNLFRQMPQIATDVEAAVKEAESADDAATKIKQVLADLAAVIDLIDKAM